jgi:hypothetical protein
MREIADKHVHGTTEEPPSERFERAEAAALRPPDINDDRTQMLAAITIFARH